jgi:hypothetical protein
MSRRSPSGDVGFGTRFVCIANWYGEPRKLYPLPRFDNNSWHYKCCKSFLPQPVSRALCRPTAVDLANLASGSRRVPQSLRELNLLRSITVFPSYFGFVQLYSLFDFLSIRAFVDEITNSLYRSSYIFLRNETS